MKECNPHSSVLLSWEIVHPMTIPPLPDCWQQKLHELVVSAIDTVEFGLDDYFVSSLAWRRAA
jgi:hypothetical protein